MVDQGSSWMVSKGRGLREVVGEQGAEPCRHPVAYMRKARKVGRDSRIICHVREQKDLEDTPRASFDDAADLSLGALGVQQQPVRSRTRTECVGATQLSS